MSGDGGDRYKTAALRVGFHNYHSNEDYGIGFNLFTGDPGPEQDPADRKHAKLSNAYGGDHEVYVRPGVDDYRLGSAYLEYNGLRVGLNSEIIRHKIQNRFAHDMGTGGRTKWFRVLNTEWKPYISFGSKNPNSLW